MASKIWWENRFKDLHEGMTFDKAFSYITNGLGFFGLGFGILSAIPSISVPVKVLLSLLISLAYIGLWAWLASIASARSRFHLVDLDKGGISLIQHIRSARQSIRATHFTSEQQSEGYVGILIDKLKEGVDTTRIYYKDPKAKPGAYDWLAKFAQFDESYVQRVTDVWLPYNLVIIDKQIVWLFLPEDQSRYYNRGLWLKNADAGHLFAHAFDRFVEEYGKTEPGAAPATDKRPDASAAALPGPPA